MSKPCCEYDILVLSNGIQPHKVMKLDSYWTELLYVPLRPKVLKSIPNSVDGIVLNDTDDLELSSIVNAVMNNTRRTSNKSAIARKATHLLLNEIQRNRESVTEICHYSRRCYSRFPRMKSCKVLSFFLGYLDLRCISWS